MKPLKDRITITVDQDIIARLKEMAEEDDRSFSQYVNLILREYLNRADQKE